MMAGTTQPDRSEDLWAQVVTYAADGSVHSGGI